MGLPRPFLSVRLPRVCSSPIPQCDLKDSQKNTLARLQTQTIGSENPYAYQDKAYFLLPQHGLEIETKYNVFSENDILLILKARVLELSSRFHEAHFLYKTYVKKYPKGKHFIFAQSKT